MICVSNITNKLEAHEMAYIDRLVFALYQFPVHSKVITVQVGGIFYLPDIEIIDEFGVSVQKTTAKGRVLRTALIARNDFGFVRFECKQRMYGLIYYMPFWILAELPSNEKEEKKKEEVEYATAQA